MNGSIRCNQNINEIGSVSTEEIDLHFSSFHRHEQKWHKKLETPQSMSRTGSTSQANFKDTLCYHQEPARSTINIINNLMYPLFVITSTLFL